MNLLTASNILFLYNKVNSLLSRWHKNHSHCFLVSSFQTKTLAATSPIYFPLPLLVQTVRLSPSCLSPFYLGGIISAVWAIKQRKCSHFLFIAPDCYRSVWHPFSSLHIPSHTHTHSSLYCYSKGCVSLISEWWAHIYRQTDRHAHIKQHAEAYIQTHTQCTHLLTLWGRSQRCVHIQGRAEFHSDTHWQTQGKSRSESSSVFLNPRWTEWAACYIHLFIFRQYWFMPVHC